MYIQLLVMPFTGCSFSEALTYFTSHLIQKLRSLIIHKFYICVFLNCLLFKKRSSERQNVEFKNNHDIVFELK